MKTSRQTKDARAISFMYIQEVAKKHLTKDLNFLKFYNMFKIFRKINAAMRILILIHF